MQPAPAAPPIRRSRREAGALRSPGALAKRGKLPYYVQCAAQFRHLVESDAWPAGHRLPALDRLAEEMGVALVTVRQAVKLLEGEGLLERRHGIGTFVVGKSGARDWLRLGTRWESLLRTLVDVEVRVVNVRRDHSHPRLQPDEGRAAAGYRFLSRLHTRGGQPLCLIQLYLDEDVHGLAPQRFDRELVLPLLTQVARARIARAWQTLRVAKADPASAEQLGLDAGDPVVKMRRVILDAAGTAVYVADITYRADVVRLEMDLIGEAPARGRARFSDAAKAQPRRRRTP